MKHEFEVGIHYTQIAIFDSAQVRPYNEWTRGHFMQGFSARPRSVSFGLPSDGQAMVTVSSVAVNPSPRMDLIRHIKTPFLSDSGIVEIGSVISTRKINIIPIMYQLEFLLFTINKSNYDYNIYMILIAHDKPIFEITTMNDIERPKGEILTDANPA